MIKIRNIYHKISSYKNLHQAAYATLLHGRRYRGEGAVFKFNLEKNLVILERELRDHTYKHGKYSSFKIYDPKERLVLAAPVRDRVVHHAVHDVIEPILDPKFIYDSYACRNGKGTHKAVRRAQGFLCANDYSLHLDVRKYFPSIDLKVMIKLLERYIGDEEALWLLRQIIDSPFDQLRIQTLPIASSQLSLFDNDQPSDNLRGLPIGNLTSQFFANLYLNELDQFIKHKLKYRYYLRYMDDMVFFSNRKQSLGDIEKRVDDFCKENLHLEIKPNSGPVFHKRGLAFLGFRIFRTHLRLKSENVHRFYRRLDHQARDLKAGEDNLEKIRLSFRSWMRHASYADTCRLRVKVKSDVCKRILPLLKQN